MIIPLVPQHIRPVCSAQSNPWYRDFILHAVSSCVCCRFSSNQLGSMLGKEKVPEGCSMPKRPLSPPQSRAARRIAKAPRSIDDRSRRPQDPTHSNRQCQGFQSPKVCVIGGFSYGSFSPSPLCFPNHHTYRIYNDVSVLLKILANAALIVTHCLLSLFSFIYTYYINVWIFSSTFSPAP